MCMNEGYNPTLNNVPRETREEILRMAQEAALAESQANAAYTAARHLEETMFRFLDELKALGKINMFHSRSYLRDEFELTKGEATKILGRWMRAYTASTKVVAND